jgi:hypothetical protein
LVICLLRTHEQLTTDRVLVRLQMPACQQGRFSTA